MCSDNTHWNDTNNRLGDTETVSLSLGETLSASTFSISLKLNAPQDNTPYTSCHTNSLIQMFVTKPDRQFQRKIYAVIVYMNIRQNNLYQASFADLPKSFVASTTMTPIQLY